MSPSRRNGAPWTFRYHGLTRRELIAAALGLSIALPVRAGEPQAKVSQRAAGYENTPKGLFS